MTKRLEIYKCNVCGNIVEVIHEGKGELVCCNEKMKNMVAGTVDAATEKHVPVIEKNGDNYLVKVGSTDHPMEEKHYIEWIQIISGNSSYRTFLKPGMDPKHEFKKLEKIKAREYCNIHGLWEKEES
jgi:superoxide reductase